MLTFFLEDPQYQFFQAVDEDGSCHESYLAKAIGQAMRFEEVDVLNMSVGCDHISDPDKECTQANPACYLSRVAEDAVTNHGITIVAASGNNPYIAEVACPSLSEYTISVGGVVHRCTGTPATGAFNSAHSPAPPPNAYFAQRSDDLGIQEPLCSNRGCNLDPDETCIDNRRVEPWEHNVAFTDRKPDTLAPVDLPSRDAEAVPMLSDGTSYAAPIVTAGIATTLAVLDQDGHTPSTTDIRQAVRNTGTTNEHIDRGHFSLLGMLNGICEQLGIPQYHENETDSLYRPD